MEKSPQPLNPHIDCNDKLLAKFKLFTELSSEELDELLRHSGTASYKAGETIISSGDVGFCMYVILRGKARVSTLNVELATLEPGDFFGEVALVDDGPRSADVVAVEDCELLTITRMTLGMLAGLQPGAAIHILAAIGRSLVARLRAGNQKYMDLILLGRKEA